MTQTTHQETLNRLLKIVNTHIYNESSELPQSIINYKTFLEAVDINTMHQLCYSPKYCNICAASLILLDESVKQSENYNPEDSKV